MAARNYNRAIRYSKIVACTKDEAKPCPFCGEQPVRQLWHGGGPKKTMVSCDSENCFVEPAATGPSRQAALDRWNFRSEE